jgi:hypothetical protein
MHSSQPDGMFVRRNSNSPAGSREQPRGQGYSAWKNSQREQQLGFEAQYGSAMDIDYAPAPGAAATPVYGGQQYAGATPVSYQPAAYPPPAHAGAAQYQAQPGYGYPPNPPQPQYSPQPQTGDRYQGIPPPPIAGSYGQDAGAFVHGSNYQTAGGYAAPPGPTNRMPQNMPHASAAPSRTYPAPTAGTPVYGTETDPYGYQPPTGNPATQAFPTDALYGRGAYATATINPPEASSDVLGSPAGTTQRPGYAAPPDSQYDAHQSPPLQSATTPTTTAPAQMASGSAPPPRRERDSEPREREPRERDHRDHRPRRSEPEREDRNRHRHR